MFWLQSVPLIPDEFESKLQLTNMSCWSQLKPISTKMNQTHNLVPRLFPLPEERREERAWEQGWNVLLFLMLKCSNLIHVIGSKQSS